MRCRSVYLLSYWKLMIFACHFLLRKGSLCYPVYFVLANDITNDKKGYLFFYFKAAKASIICCYSKGSIRVLSIWITKMNGASDYIESKTSILFKYFFIRTCPFLSAKLMFSIKWNGIPPNSTLLPLPNVYMLLFLIKCNEPIFAFSIILFSFKVYTSVAITLMLSKLFVANPIYIDFAMRKPLFISV